MINPVIIGNATLYHGDCRDVLESLPVSAAVITDPVWPNCPAGLLTGSDSPDVLLGEALSLCQSSTVVIILGFNSDPRFLTVVPAKWPFVRSQNLPYAMPGYRGRLLGGDEIAYVFGEIPKGRGVIPGRARTITDSRAMRANGHPCPRADSHMEQIVGWWSPQGSLVVDPFMGGGATGVACARAGREFVGIEIEQKYFDIACERIDQAQRQQRLFA